MKRALIVVLLAGGILLSLPAQSNQLVDRMLEDEGADVADSAYMVLVSAGAIDEGASTSDAVEYAREQGWIGDETEGSDTITFGQLAYFLMEAHGEPGGLMYRLIPGPRYAAREAVFQQWSVEDRPPGEEISGSEVLKVLGNFRRARGAE